MKRAALITAEWALRTVLIVVMAVHGLGKLQYPVAFAEKFDLALTLGIAAGAAEILGVAGVLAGGVLARHRLGAVLTWLGCLAIVAVQVGAIAIARWPRWLEYAQPPGMEYNVTLLAVCLALAALALIRARSFTRKGTHV